MKARKINYKDENALITILDAATQEGLLDKIEEFGEGKDILNISYCNDPKAVFKHYEAMIIYYDDETENE